MSTKSGSLPGRDKSVDYVAEPDRVFRSLLIDLNEAALPLTTLRELTMLQFMDDIADKPDWNININDPEVIAKWKEEAHSSYDDVTQKMFDWCIDELRYKASLIPQDSTGKQPPFIVYNGDVVKSDTALSVEFKQALQKAITEFEQDIPDKSKDSRPGSDGKVWDLVDPSLYPFIYGRTRVLELGSDNTTLDDCIERCGEGNIVEYPGMTGVLRPQYAEELPYSKKFQWLPCEVDISGDAPRITSYINNLHPSEKSLYGLIETMIKASIPLWDLTLAPARSPPHTFVLRIPYDIDDYSHRRVNSDNEDESESESDDDGDQQSSQLNICIEPKTFTPSDSPIKLNLKDEYGHLQVIVRLTNIELTPEKPDFDDVFWHIETPLNEHIVATSFYFYSCSNIKPDAGIGFRQIFSSSEMEFDRDYESNDPQWLTTLFGYEQFTPAGQTVGAVVSREGRLLTFPNTLQYSMNPFELEDPSKPGHLKFVALCLVDPNIRIISTAHVPCQRQDWWFEAIQRQAQLPSASTPSTSETLLKRLPVELKDHIVSEVDIPISLQHAKVLREELIEERKDFEGDFEEKIEVYDIVR